MAIKTQRDEIPFLIPTGVAAKLLVMNFQIRHRVGLWAHFLSVSGSVHRPSRPAIDLCFPELVRDRLKPSDSERLNGIAGHGSLARTT